MASSSLMNDRAWPRSPTFGLVSRRVIGARRLRLLPRGDGWSLVSVEGEFVFSALGLSGRRRCLEFARARCGRADQLVAFSCAHCSE